MLLKHAAARLMAAPMFTIFSVLSLAAGVAVTTAAYSVVDALSTGDLGVSDPDRVAFVVTPSAGRTQYASVSDPDFGDLRETQTSFSSMSASSTIYPSVATSTHAEVLIAEAVDGAYFATVGVGAHLGRVIQPKDDETAARVAVLSDELWRSRFGGAAEVVGRTIRINGQPFEIVGVAAARYRGTFGKFRSTRLWIPLSAEPSSAPTRHSRPQRCASGAGSSSLDGSRDTPRPNARRRNWLPSGRASMRRIHRDNPPVAIAEPGRGRRSRSPISARERMWTAAWA